MGQYYRPVISDSGHFSTFDNRLDGKYVFAKLTEHSWWDNPWVCTIAKAILNHPAKVAWVGDYSDDEEFAVENHLYELAWEVNASLLQPTTDPIFLDGKFLVNHDKKIYIDCNQYKEDSTDENGWTLHPLPLLTAIGNGKGGGDYRGINEDLIGSWCYDLISLEDNPPDGYTKEKYKFIDE